MVGADVACGSGGRRGDGENGDGGDSGCFPPAEREKKKRKVRSTYRTPGSVVIL
jgi:hypothetical protein